jgi:hypothetical protein
VIIAADDETVFEGQKEWSPFDTREDDREEFSIVSVVIPFGEIEGA